MKKVIIIIGVIMVAVITCAILTFNLFGCSSELPQLVSQNVIIYSESMTEYDEFGGLNSLRDTAIYELREHYDIDYYKYDPAIGFYTILKTDTGILLLTFDWTPLTGR